MKKVYLCISTDVIQTGHINIINEAAKLGEVTVGVLCDECAAKYERYPLIPLEQ
jgi:phosphoenolpyruvate mutase